MGVRAFLRLVTVLCFAGLTLVVFDGVASASECPNEARREEQNSTHLPDCRAYEMVTPTEKNSSDVIGKGRITEASSDGERVAFGARAGFADAEASAGGGVTQYIASRNGGSWTTHAITPLADSDAFQFVLGATNSLVFSEDLSTSIVESYDLPAATNDVPHEVNTYREANASRSLETITTDPAENPVELFSLVGTPRAFSPDLSVVAFETRADLTPEATGFANKLYEWRDGQLKVAGILPNGTAPAEGSSAAVSREPLSGLLKNAHTVSGDGSHIAFVSPAAGANPQLYVRLNGTRTVWVSESEASSPVAEPKKVRFQSMSADGSKILFTSGDPLTDSDPGGAGEGLYMYTDGPSPATETNLQYIGRVSPVGPAYSEQIVIGASADLKRFYFETAATGTFAEPGIYIWDEGSLRSVALPVGSLFFAKGEPVVSLKTTGAQVSNNAQQLAFVSYDDLTEDVNDGQPKIAKMYVYDEKTDALSCVSCLSEGRVVFSDATTDPDASHAGVGIELAIKPRFITKDGRYVFFSTADALLPQDVNGLYDAYEYDTATGEISLLSSGVGQNGAWYVTSGASGGDAFIATRDSLVAGDPDTLVDIYDVRVDGGFPQPQPQVGGCEGDECQGVPSAAPSFDTASGFSGLGNISSAKSTVLKQKTLSRTQKLARALKACKHKSRRARKRCKAQARRKYAARKTRKGTFERARR